MLERRILGDTGIEVSAIALGTVKFGRNTKVKYPKDFNIPNDIEVVDILNLARDIGINLIDTAPAYGIAEERLGTFFSKNKRDNWIICSKVGEEYENNESVYNYTPEFIDFSIKRSLKRLKTDYIDIMLIHSNGDDENIIRTGALECLQHYKDKGLIRATGMSTKTRAGGLLALSASDIVMCTYNPWDKSQVDILDKASENNKGILIKKALNSGNLGGDDISPADAIKFILQHHGVSSIVIGSINPVNIKANVQAVEYLK